MLFILILFGMLFAGRWRDEFFEDIQRFSAQKIIDTINNAMREPVYTEDLKHLPEELLPEHGYGQNKRFAPQVRLKIMEKKFHSESEFLKYLYNYTLEMRDGFTALEPRMSAIKSNSESINGAAFENYADLVKFKMFIYLLYFAMTKQTWDPEKIDFNDELRNSIRELLGQTFEIEEELDEFEIMRKDRENIKTLVVALEKADLYELKKKNTDERQDESDSESIEVEDAEPSQNPIPIRATKYHQLGSVGLMASAPIIPELEPISSNNLNQTNNAPCLCALLNSLWNCVFWVFSAILYCATLGLIDLFEMEEYVQIEGEEFDDNYFDL